MGAPYDGEDHTGAVYIYMGGEEGITKKPAQRISSGRNSRPSRSAELSRLGRISGRRWISVVARRTPPPKQRRNEVRKVWWRGPAIPPTPRTLLLNDVNKTFCLLTFSIPTLEE